MTTRFSILLVSVVMAFNLYLHRVALGEIIKYDSFISEMGASRETLGKVLGAFFLTYALFQIPAGWLSDRLGGRPMLTVYMIAWSITTGLTGMVSNATQLLLARYTCGMAQAGAYPTSGSIIRRWFPPQERALASGWVTMGGRLGGTFAPLITGSLIAFSGSWRWTLIAMAVSGVFFSLLYWWIVRDAPSEATGDTSSCEDPTTVAVPRVTPEVERPRVSEIPRLLWNCLKSPSMALNASVQFATNVGWVFLITWLPTYLTQEKGVPELQGAAMVSFILGVGIPAQIIGGFCNNWSVRKMGLRWGRVFPLSVASGFATMAYFGCLGFDNVWIIVGLCATVSFMTDVGNPTFWAYAQDVGGKNTASILGWCNMVGNLGAALSAVLIPFLMTLGEKWGVGSTPVFVLCGLAYLFCTVASLGIDATRKIDPATS